MIEILTKEIYQTPIYYEIGTRLDRYQKVIFTGQGIHGPDIKLFDGDVMFRNVSCRTPDGSLDIVDQEVGRKNNSA